MSSDRWRCRFGSEPAAKLMPGAKLKVVFKSEREGRITDFHYELA